LPWQQNCFFFYIFSFDFIRAGLDGHFGVLHAPVYRLGNTKRPKKQQKWLKISVFVVTMATNNNSFTFLFLPW